MKPKVYIARDVLPEVEAYIAEHCEVRRWRGEGTLGYDRMLEELQDAEGLLTTGGRIDAKLLEHGPNLKVVSNISVGYDNFDVQAMLERGVLGTHTPEVLDDSVADLILGLMLSSARRLTELDAYVKRGDWQKGANTELFGLDVHHATLGILGMGRIGEAVAKRCRLGLDMEVVYHNRTRKPDVEERLGVSYASKQEVLRQADFLVVMVPLTPETEKYIGEEDFKLMKPTAFFINAARGKVVDEAALISALQQGRICGAGLDVFEKEPVDPANPLLTMSNVVTLPHIGSATAKTRLDMAMLAARNLVLAVKGERPVHVVKELQPLLDR
ncbi:2-hydroxyacid dehydrogenase [Paenibacillus sp. y28]|uniref:2-hydroxyacid dehydrogenase n=1 Tax=Paenibacillus sp. y28 TaxID=3129110 RepID=UPI00301AC4A4